MKKDWHNLSWLPDAPDDFARRCDALTPKSADDLRRLAACRLNDNQLRKLARTCAAFPGPLAGFEPFRLGIVGNANSDYLKDALKASALRHGVWLDVVIAGMSQTTAALLDPSSMISQEKPDAVLAAYNWRALPPPDDPADGPGAAAAIRHLLDEIDMMAATLAERGATLIVQTIPQAPFALFGSLDRRLPATQRAMIDAFNAALMAGKHAVIDIAALAETTGLATWDDAGQWHWAKLPFAQALIPLYADYVARFLGALRGRSRKCLVLDLDNTLWHGVIGDDGLEGIVLGSGSPLGEAYLAIQNMALALRNRGIVLAVCSKNDEKNARLPFHAHPEQVLKENHIAVIQANWNDKASNLEAIASALDLTPDSLVFLDDNPAEREIIRREVPAVAVPEIPAGEPALWPQILSAAGYFEAAQFTEADRDRAAQYAANAQRQSLQVSSRNLADYLRALAMEMTVSPFTPVNRGRVAQLINRSNQYNLTSHRYTEAQLDALSNDPAVAGFAIRLRDRFGDNGIISVVICCDDGETWIIDTWLMSCRVLGRQVEQAVLAHIAAQARHAGKSSLIGYYIPTPKNGMTKDHYQKLGFGPVETKANGETVWMFDLRDFQPQSLPMMITIENAMEDNS